MDGKKGRYVGCLKNDSPPTPPLPTLESNRNFRIKQPRKLNVAKMTRRRKKGSDRVAQSLEGRSGSTRQQPSAATRSRARPSSFSSRPLKLQRYLQSKSRGCFYPRDLHTRLVATSNEFISADFGDSSQAPKLCVEQYESDTFAIPICQMSI